jgi:hypothetical protein
MERIEQKESVDSRGHMKVRQNNNSNGSTSSKASGILSKREGGKKATKVNKPSRGSAAAIKFFDDLRQQYVDGKLSRRQIATLKDRLPDTFLEFDEYKAEKARMGSASYARMRITHIPLNPLGLVPVRSTVVAPAVTGTTYTMKRSKGKKAAK